MRESVRTVRFGGQIVLMVPALVSPTNPAQPSFLYIHITGNLTYRSATNWALEGKTFSVPFPALIQMFPRLVSAPFPWKYSCRGRIPDGHTSACPVSVMFPTMLCVFCSHVQDQCSIRQNNFRKFSFQVNSVEIFRHCSFAGGFFTFFHK